MVVLCVLVQVCAPPGAWAQVINELKVRPAPDWSAYQGQPLSEVRVEMLGELFRQKVTVRSVRPGDLVSPELVRRGLRELVSTGRVASADAVIQQDGTRLVLVYRVRPRRLVATVRFYGGVLDPTAERRALGLEEDDEITDLSLEAAKKRLLKTYRQAGYLDAEVEVAVEETDDPMHMLVRVNVRPGVPQEVENVSFRVAPSPHLPVLGSILKEWSVERGDRLDQQVLEEARGALQESLVRAGFVEAQVTTKTEPSGRIIVRAKTGPLYSVRIEGNETFDDERLTNVLELAEFEELRPELLEAKLRQFYVDHGFLDARIRFRRIESRDGLRTEMYAWIREGQRFTVTGRRFPCLSGNKTVDEINEEIDGVLAEQFPGVVLLKPPPSDDLDAALGTPHPKPRARPLQPAPWSSYSEEAWEAVRTHLRDLYRSDGYLSAEVGPVTLVRRRCAGRSPPGECVVDGPLPMPVVDCRSRPKNVGEVTETCVPNPETGVRCSPKGVLVVPIRAGRQAILYDVAISGNERFTEQRILEATDFDLGEPFRAAEIDDSIERLEELYLESGYAFVQIDSDLELSPDGTRARLVISITEGDPVRVRRIEVRGADITREGLIRSRLALREGGLYRRSLVRRTRDQVESLGAFTSVSVGFEDAGVPAREKVVVVNVNERLPQYLDIKGGFATGDGFRVGFEYGHRNLGGEAIQLTIRSLLGLRPVGLIPEEDVRQRYSTLDLGDLLERRNTLTVAFPNTGLGPRYRFEVEFLDVRDNNRDFGQTRDAGVVRLSYRPHRKWWMQVGATVERNEAGLIGVDDQDRALLDDYVRENPSSRIRVPEGTSLAVTQNIGATWDRRDQALAATRGTYVSAVVEHVTAVPRNLEVDQEEGCQVMTSSAFDPVCSELLRYTGRVAGYVPLDDGGLALAFSLRGGVVQHLTDVSQTYPDRLFFMGGIDTMRGYPQDSLVPQDLADRVLDPNDDLAIENVVLRGGDIFVNPRLELRIPVMGSLHTAIFVDSGNLWTDPTRANFLNLRYTAGTGIRFETPIGPLVFDYGFNIARVIDGFSPSSEQERDWEDLGAFHFSIGLF